MKEKYIIFIFFRFLLLEVSGACTSDFSPKNYTDCNIHSDENTYCCFLKPVNNNETQNRCLSILHGKYNGDGTINYNKIPYSIYCGMGTVMGAYSTTSSYGNSCGVMMPKTPEICSQFSTEQNSCCYYENGHLTGCYWLGAKYESHVEVDGKKFSCFSRSLKIKITIIFIIFSILTFL
jgi:hypothetical protein